VALDRGEVLLEALRGEQLRETVESWDSKEETHPGRDQHQHQLDPSPISDFRTTKQSTRVFCNSLIIGTAFREVSVP